MDAWPARYWCDSAILNINKIIFNSFSMIVPANRVLEHQGEFFQFSFWDFETKKTYFFTFYRYKNCLYISKIEKNSPWCCRAHILYNNLEYDSKLLLRNLYRRRFWKQRPRHLLAGEEETRVNLLVICGRALSRGGWDIGVTCGEANWAFCSLIRCYIWGDPMGLLGESPQGLWGILKPWFALGLCEIRSEFSLVWKR